MSNSYIVSYQCNIIMSLNLAKHVWGFKSETEIYERFALTNGNTFLSVIANGEKYARQEQQFAEQVLNASVIKNSLP